MAWTKQQKAAHSKRMKAMWAKKAGKSEIVPPAADPVNHPTHYTSHPSGIECIQVTEHLNFCLGNAIKYIWRAGEKGSKIEDLKKAVWYLQREIERINHATARS